MAAKPQTITKLTLNDCLINGTDLSDDWIYLIIYFPHSFPGMEYEILCEQKPEYLLLQKGDTITVFDTPTVRTQGSVAAIKTNVHAIQTEYDFLVQRRKRFNEENERIHKQLQANRTKIKYMKYKLRDAETQTEASELSSDEEKHRHTEHRKKYENPAELVPVLLRLLDCHNNNSNNCTHPTNQHSSVEHYDGFRKRLNSQENCFGRASTSSPSTSSTCSSSSRRSSQKIPSEDNKENGKNCKCFNAQEIDSEHISTTVSNKTREKRSLQRRFSENNNENAESYSSQDEDFQKDVTISSRRVKKRKASQDLFSDDDVENMEDYNGQVKIGPGGTTIPKKIFSKINWAKHTSATRKLLMEVFPREVLATHCLTGKPSPAFLNSGKETKMRLDPSKINDIVEIVSRKCNITPSMVRNAITTKCADENKLYRKRMRKQGSSKEENDTSISDTSHEIKSKGRSSNLTQ